MSDLARTSVAPKARQAGDPAAGGLLQRQCACGNHTVAGGECAQCAKKKQNQQPLQRKLTVGAANDPLEREADQVAYQVLAAPSHHKAGSAPPLIQRYTGQTAGQADTAPASVDRALAGPGRPLDPALRQNMEPRFGHDFSRVRVHSGGEAEQSARDVSANAYTVGHSIVFGAGQFAPGTPAGRRLIAHELAHVVQQSDSSGTRISSLQNTSESLILQRDETSPSLGPTPGLPQKVVPGSSPLSRETQAYRIAHPDLAEGINLVAVEYSAPGVAQPQRKVFENRPGVAHSEEVMDQFFRDLRSSTRQEIKVHKIYSERQFCGPSDHDCEGLLLRSARYKLAEKTFGYDYQEAAPRARGGGPYRAGQSKNQIRESHERLNETKNLEWDFQKRPTQPNYERKGQPSSPKTGAVPKPSPQTGRASARGGSGVGVMVGAELATMILSLVANYFLQKYYAEELSAHADKTLHEAIGASRGQFEKVIAQSLRTIEDAQAEGRNVSVVAEYELDWQDGRDTDTGLSIGKILMSARLVNARVVLEGETANKQSPKAEGAGKFAAGLAKDLFNDKVGRSLTQEMVNVPLTGTDEKVRRFKKVEQLLKNAKPGSDEFDVLTKEREDLLPYYQAFANARKQRNAEEAAMRAKADAESKLEEERRRQAKAEQILAEQAAREKFRASQTPSLPGPGPVGQGAQLTGPFFGPTQMGKMEQSAYAAQLFRNRRAVLIAEAKKNPTGEKLAQLRAERDRWLHDIKWFFANVVDKELKSGQWSDGWSGVHDLKDMLKWAQGLITDDNNVLLL